MYFPHMQNADIPILHGICGHWQLEVIFVKYLVWCSIKGSFYCWNGCSWWISCLLAKSTSLRTARLELKGKVGSGVSVQLMIAMKILL